MVGDMVPEAMWDGWEAALVALADDRDFAQSEEGHRRRVRDRRDARPGAGRARRAARSSCARFATTADADLAALLHEEMRECLRRYEARKQEAGALDFLDLLIKARDLVRDNPDVCREFRERFRVILVDEFQDTDPLQADLLLQPRRRRRRRRSVPARCSSSAIRSSRSTASAAPTSAPIAASPTTSARAARSPVTLQTSFRSVPAIQHFVNAAFRDDMNGDREALQADYVPLLPHRADTPEQPAIVALPVPRPYGKSLYGPPQVTQTALNAVAAAGDCARSCAGCCRRSAPGHVPIRGHVSGQTHREFAMASGEMSADEFLAFNQAWMEQVGHYLVDGGLFGTFIDWRGYSTVDAAATAVGLDPLNLVVWSKTNAGMGSLYRSAHELLPLYKKGTAAHVNNVQLGRYGRWRSNVWTYPGASSLGSDSRQGLSLHPTVKPTAMIEDALLDLTHRDDIVLDPFLGSGSTVMAAEKAGRTCRGVEIDPRYVDVAVRRFEEASGIKAVRLNA